MSDQPKTKWTEEAKARIASSEAKSGNDPEFAKFAQSETDKTLASKADETSKAQDDKTQVDNASADKSQADNTQGGDDQGEQKK